MSKMDLRNKIESLYDNPCWEGFGLYIKTGEVAGFLDENGDVIPNTDNIVQTVLNDFNTLSPKTPNDWCTHLNNKYAAQLNCSQYIPAQVQNNKETLIEKIKRIFLNNIQIEQCSSCLKIYYAQLLKKLSEIFQAA